MLEAEAKLGRRRLRPSHPSLCYQAAKGCWVCCTAKIVIADRVEEREYAWQGAGGGGQQRGQAHFAPRTAQNEPVPDPIESPKNHHRMDLQTHRRTTRVPPTSTGLNLLHDAPVSSIGHADQMASMWNDRSPIEPAKLHQASSCKSRRQQSGRN